MTTGSLPDNGREAVVEAKSSGRGEPEASRRSSTDASTRRAISSLDSCICVADRRSLSCGLPPRSSLPINRVDDADYCRVNRRTRSPG